MGDNIIESMEGAQELYSLQINGRMLKSPIAIASMAGIVDAAYVLERAAHIGAAFIGGYSIDRETMRASSEMASQGRREFLCEDPIAELKTQISRLQGTDLVVGVNLRGSSPESFLQVIEALGEGVIYEIDAHCRQEPMILAGSGEHYLRHPGALVETVRRMKESGATVSVKIRVGVADSDPALARDLWKAGADIIHIDLMDEGHRKLKRIRNACNALLIANNSIYTYDRMMQMFSHGADLVSLARRSDEATLAGLDAAIARYAGEYGWYNAPKQLCRGGDIRALTFCCLPVKNCPLIPFLNEVGLEREDYIRIKQKAVAGTPLENGDLTCFGSLAWCCKATSPCMLRDATLKSRRIPVQRYMQEKRRLAGILMESIFGGR